MGKLSFPTREVSLTLSLCSLPCSPTQGILANVAYPLMCFNDEDAELWNDDHQEYIRKVRRGGSAPAGILGVLR